MSSVNCGSSAVVCVDRRMEVFSFFLCSSSSREKHLINDIYAFFLPRDSSSSSTLKTLNYIFQMHYRRCTRGANGNNNNINVDSSEHSAYFHEMFIFVIKCENACECAELWNVQTIGPARLISKINREKLCSKYFYTLPMLASSFSS